MNQEINPEMLQQLLQSGSLGVQQESQQSGSNSNPFADESQGSERPNYLPTVVQDDSALARLKEDVEENHKNVKICMQNNLYMRQMVDALSESQHEILNKVEKLMNERTKIAEQCEVLCKQCCDRENESLKESIGLLRNEVDELKRANHEVLQNAPNYDINTKAVHAARMDENVSRLVQLLKHASAQRNMPPGRVLILRSF